MKDISRVEQSERVNYDIAEGMINYTINRLKETSESFNKKFEEDSRDYAHSRTNTIIKYLKDNDLYSLESEEIVKTVQLLLFLLTVKPYLILVQLMRQSNSLPLLSICV